MERPVPSYTTVYEQIKTRRRAMKTFTTMLVGTLAVAAFLCPVETLQADKGLCPKIWPLSDCNQNQIDDRCDVGELYWGDCQPCYLFSESPDCNENGIPDECEIHVDSWALENGSFCTAGCEPDCNNNGVPDECDIADGTSRDCNDDGIPNECEDNLENMACGTRYLCNICELDCGPPLDPCHVLGCGEAADCNANGLPDDCETSAFTLSSTLPLGFGPPPAPAWPVEYHFYNAPPAKGIVTFSFAAIGDLDDPPVEYVEVTLDKDPLPWLESIYGDAQHVNACERPATEDSFTMPATDFNDSLAFNGGDLVIKIRPSIYVEWDDDCHGAITVTVSYYTASDCNANDIPDVCEQDCNENGVPDDCDIADGTSLDCNANAVPDECDLSGGTSEDCNSNTVPDECDIAGATSADCNDNDTPDECDIADGTSEDCDVNGVPDECQEDCNSNGIPDVCDIMFGTSSDCNENGIPDECDLSDQTSQDCNENVVPDECDIASGTSEDCNDNGIPDECDLSDQTSQDCNVNLVPDECDIASGTSQDCNENGVPDDCDVFGGTSEDCNGNIIPDECDAVLGEGMNCNGDQVPDTCEAVSGAGSLWVRVEPARSEALPGGSGSPYKLLVQLDIGYECQCESHFKWVVSVDAESRAAALGENVADAVANTKEGWGVIYIKDAIIGPGQSYTVLAWDVTAEEFMEDTVGQASTNAWGDMACDGTYEPIMDPPVFYDPSPGLPDHVRDLYPPCDPDGSVDFSDELVFLSIMQGAQYCDECPSSCFCAGCD
jgi:hypothetical protein